MPLKQKNRKKHHVAHHKEKRTKHFLKVYAPYIPLLLLVATGIFLLGTGQVKTFGYSSVKSYATNTSDDGLLAQTNKMRDREGLPALAINPELDAAAQEKAQDMANRNYWSHITPDGKEPWHFIENQGYHYQKAAENLAFGFIDSRSTVAGWMNSPTHRANIMDPALQEVGFGIINVPNFQDHGQETIVVAMYGTPASPLATASSPLSEKAPVGVESSSKNVSYIESLTQGKAPWSDFILGLVIGSAVMYLVVKHARSLRKAIKKSEKFVISHPLLDITITALIIVAYIAIQNVGQIY